MKKVLKLVAATVIAATAIAKLSPAGATDFSCRSASNAAERAICGDSRLSQLDDRMAGLYGRLWSVSDHRSRLELRNYQQRFLSSRNACGWNNRCIRDAYLDQIGVLDQRLTEISN